ncbi:hypothetical protein T440DRAFT_556368 [Plenodomus tracheiphilus IPT5]|uniref:Uncharacterized protein n=1 Tax=Plenodomus tracheiphilus IPT5 TaxID=1408161 RepID=A0A6A7B300_9PLEO|nr:hypothetical protein T440DRAFT_556368 [Plenodomus tracheiphilus IPT5]
MKRWLDPDGTEAKAKQRSKASAASSKGMVQSISETGSRSSNEIDCIAMRQEDPLDHHMSVPKEPDTFSETIIICYGSLLDLVAQVRDDQFMNVESTPLKVTECGFLAVETSFIGEYLVLRLPNAAPLGKAAKLWRQAGKSAMLSIDLNVYGNPRSARKVGEILSAAKLFLQTPALDARGLRYDNPQYLKLPGVPHVRMVDESKETVDEPTQERQEEVSRSEIDSILDHLPQPRFLREVSTSDRIRTPLMSYQKEAVDFINRRETSDLPPSLSLWKPHAPPGGSFCYQHVITGAKSSEMDDVTGGMISDDMGLGKTLSMLAVIVDSLGRAVEGALADLQGATTHWETMTPSKATLVVVPNALLLESWKEEIETHIAPGVVELQIYHGHAKRVDLPTLLRSDIVITTYATIVAEFSRGRSTLNHIHWYRLVLDEGSGTTTYFGIVLTRIAHYIRNSSTKQFRAIRSIPAKIRWCLTGTPIQNSLEDLAALMKFLRVPILDDLAIFRRQVTIPVFSKTNSRFTNLRRLLEALCLRRTKTLLGLPEPITETRFLEFSQPERAQYHDYANLCKHAIGMAVSEHSFRKVNQHVIQAILGMRLFCNDGKSALIKRQNMLELPDDPEQTLSYVQTDSTSTCIDCGIEIVSLYQAEDSTSGILTVCQHLICSICLPDYEADLDEAMEDGRSECRFCRLRADRLSFILRPSPSSHEKTAHIVPEEEYSTKLRQVVQDIKSRGANDKSLVFSSWKTSLDIVAQALEDSSISFYRIHGSLPAAKRSQVLNDFEHSTNIKTLLITLGTGAVGLNKLKVANHVHIIEPQWNPSVENQAIGRVLRLGQRQSVKIIRYIMKGSVEEAVQSRQLRKLQLVRGGFGFTKDDHGSQRITEIMSLMCPSVAETGAANIATDTLVDIDDD